MEALKKAIRERQALAYEFGKNELHVWPGDLKRGDHCQCGARTWM